MTTELDGHERMSFATYARIDETADTFAPIRELGLEPNVAELDEYGYTVVPPEKVISPSALNDLREQITGLAARSFGIPVADVGDGSATAHRSFFQHQMLAEGECFEQVLMNPADEPGVTRPHYSPARRKLRAVEHGRVHEGSEREVPRSAH
jgi:hypothetical protein